MPNLEIHLVRGNHDLQSGDPWPELRITAPGSMDEFDFDLRHLPVEGEQRPFLAGHLHPGFSLKEKTAPPPLTLLSRRKKPIIRLPLEVLRIRKIKPVGDDRIFATNGQEIIEVPTY